MFIRSYLFEKEREKAHMQAGIREEGEGKAENPKQTVCRAQSPMQGSIHNPWGHKLSQNQESEA